MCAVLAALSLLERRENACWRTAYEEDQAAPQYACTGPG
jgi:hypothetical protein